MKINEYASKMNIYLQRHSLTSLPMNDSFEKCSLHTLELLVIFFPIFNASAQLLANFSDCGKLCNETSPSFLKVRLFE